MHLKEKNMLTQYSVLCYKNDLYSHEYKLAIEVDELGCNNRNMKCKGKRQ